MFGSSADGKKTHRPIIGKCAQVASFGASASQPILVKVNFSEIGYHPKNIRVKKHIIPWRVNIETPK